MNGGAAWTGTSGGGTWATNDDECSSADDKCLRLENGAQETRLTDATGFYNLEINFYLNCQNMEATNSNFKLQWVLGGTLQGNYLIIGTNVGSGTSGSWYNQALPTGADNQPNLGVRLDTDGTARCWVDEVTLTGDTLAPSKAPTTKAPTTRAPTTKSPTTKSPTTAPTSKDPTKAPTKHPSASPSKTPSTSPTNVPTTDPTMDPTSDPTYYPTNNPTTDPTTDPTVDPTLDPTSDPTSDPTTDPTFNPSESPSLSPTKRPTTPAPTLVLNVNAPTVAPTASENEMTDSPTSTTKSTTSTKEVTQQTQSGAATASDTLINNPYVIALMVIIAVLVCLICLLICCMCRKSKQKRRKEQARRALELGQFSSGIDDDVLNEGDGYPTTLPNNNTGTTTTNKDLTRTVSPTLASMESGDAGLTIINYAISDPENDTHSDHEDDHMALAQIYNHNMPHLMKDNVANGTLNSISTMINPYSVNNSPNFMPQYRQSQHQNLPNNGFIDQHGALSNIVDQLPPPPDPRESMDIPTAGMISDDEDSNENVLPRYVDEDDLLYKQGSSQRLTATAGNTPKDENNIKKLYNPKAEGMVASSIRLCNSDFNLDKVNDDNEKQRLKLHDQDTPQVIDVNEDIDTDGTSTTDGNIDEDTENDAKIVYDESSSNIKGNNNNNSSSDSDDDIYDSANEQNEPNSPNGDNSPK